MTNEDISLRLEIHKENGRGAFKVVQIDEYGNICNVWSDWEYHNEEAFEKLYNDVHKALDEFDRNRIKR